MPPTSHRSRHNSLQPPGLSTIILRMRLTPPAWPSRDRINRFFLFSWFLVALNVATFSSPEQYKAPFLAFWTLGVTLTYGALYLLPAWGLGLFFHWVCHRFAATRLTVALLAFVLISLTGLTQTYLFADRLIYVMYGFHINGFVVDLVMSPGGIASLGASQSTQITAAGILVGFFAAHTVLYLWFSDRLDSCFFSLRRINWSLLFFLALCLMLGERLAYAYSKATNFRPVLMAAERYPHYLPMTSRKLAQYLGIKEGVVEESFRVKSTALRYPLAPLNIVPPSRPLNIVWLVAESLRFDMLHPKIMPRLHDFSRGALRLDNHFSGGIQTQMGVFSMFYGLYSTYWFPMLDHRQPPVLMEVLKQQNYRFGLYTSQRFTYPAFDKTVFAGLDPALLHERAGGAEPWQRDRLNVSDLLDFIDRKESGRPFMAYLFFESTHANYSFPPESEIVIAQPYLEDLNYLTADFRQDIEKIKNRYINASRHVDQQIGRVVDHLHQRNLLDSTVVIVLGDHGEEFMERSRWGHSAEFNRFQTSTPAVIRIPGVPARAVSSLTSHLDIPATLMPLLGVRNAPSDYSLGFNLLDADFARRYAVAGDWNRIAYINDSLRITFPVNVTGSVRNEANDGEDRPLADAAAARAAIRPSILEMMNGMGRFLRRGAD